VFIDIPFNPTFQNNGGLSADGCDVVPNGLPLGIIEAKIVNGVGNVIVVVELETVVNPH
jgi:hypothetical protein